MIKEFIRTFAVASIAIASPAKAENPYFSGYINGTELIDCETPGKSLAAELLTYRKLSIQRPILRIGDSSDASNFITLSRQDSTNFEIRHHNEGETNTYHITHNDVVNPRGEQEKVVVFSADKFGFNTESRTYRVFPTSYNQVGVVVGCRLPKEEKK